MPNVTLAGFVYNNAGEAISGATVQAFTRNDDTETEVAQYTSLGSGYWTLSVADQMYDVKITSGSSIRWIKYDDQAQMETLEVANFFIRDPDNTYDYNIKPAAIGADYELNLPLLTGNDTLAAIGFAQTWTADQTFNDSVKVTLGTGGDADLYYDGTDVVLDVTVVGSGDFYVKGGRVEVDDDEGVAFGTGKDATINYDGTDLIISPAAVGSGDVSISGGSLEVGDAEGTRYGAGQDVELRWSLADTTNHAFVVGLGTLNAAMHIANIGDIATDWDVSAEADPQLFIHCNTNPATEYLRIGNLDATNAEIDLVGGTTIKFQIDGTDEMTLTASALDLKSNNLVFTSGSGIDFSNTADSTVTGASTASELFDDYEEGTWTPLLGDGDRDMSGEGSQGYSVQIGRYTKIGNRVFFTCTITISDLGDLTQSEQAAILGLPFSSENTANSYSPVAIGDMTGGAITGGQVVTGFVGHNRTDINLRLWDSTVGCTDFLISELSADGRLVISGNYRV